MFPPRLASYSHREVKHLVRAVSSMTEQLDRKTIHAKVIDFKRAFDRLSEEWPDEAAAVYVCGVYQVDFRDAEAILGMSSSTIHTWYSSGLRHLTKLMNGEMS